ncbi:hypothetical protein ACFX12_002248 [Malus domestica]
MKRNLLFHPPPLPYLLLKTYSLIMHRFQHHHLLKGKMKGLLPKSNAPLLIIVMRWDQTLYRLYHLLSSLATTVMVMMQKMN